MADIASKAKAEVQLIALLLRFQHVASSPYLPRCFNVFNSFSNSSAFATRLPEDFSMEFLTQGLWIFR